MSEKFFNTILDIMEDIKNCALDETSPEYRAYLSRINKLRKEIKAYYEEHHKIMSEQLEKAKKIEQELEESGREWDEMSAKWKRRLKTYKTFTWTSGYV